MTPLPLLALATLLPGPLPPLAEPANGIAYAQVTVRSHIVIRVETAPAPATPVPRPYRPRLRERRGPHCIAMADLAGAAVIEPNSVDLALRNGTRMRLRLAASCPGLDYYSGFYVAPTADAKICAARDVVRDRAGGECAVDRIRELVPPR